MKVLQDLVLIAASLLLGEAVAAGDLVGHALVRSDGSLLIRERVVHLHGIYIPRTNRQCREWIRPVRCDARAVLQLDALVRGFVHCEPRHERVHGQLEAVCHVDRTQFDSGIDLGAHLIENGWALARPDAPFEYHAMERIARERGLGVWGFTIDSIQNGARH